MWFFLGGRGDVQKVLKSKLHRMEATFIELTEMHKALL